MKMFKDRKEAGQRLSLLLASFKNKKDTIVIALPRGGVVVAHEIASFLHLPLDLVIPRKIGAPNNEELAIGAIAQDALYLNKELINTLQISEEYIKQQIQKEKLEAKRRENLYRKKKEPLNVKNKTVLLIDDGIATGATMLASIHLLKKKHAKQILVAIPVAPKDSIEKIKKEAKVFTLATPDSFGGISQFYDKFEQISDEKIISLLQ